MYATDRAADDVLSGRCDHLLPEGGMPDSERWFTRIHGDGELDVWLISWVPGRATELHDHGGSAGCMTWCGRPALSQAPPMLLGRYSRPSACMHTRRR
jgi:hypothetical protein